MCPLGDGPGVMRGIDVVLLAMAEETAAELLDEDPVEFAANGAVLVVVALPLVELKLATR